jgi:prepilin peptidase CpaA
LGVGAAAFATMPLFYRLGWVGGGDVKLAGAVVLWSGPTLVPLVMVLVGLGGFLLALVMLALRPLHRRRGEVSGFLDERRGVPYGIPLALAGAVVVTAPWLSIMWR